MMATTPSLSWSTDGVPDRRADRRRATVGRGVRRSVDTLHRAHAYDVRDRGVGVRARARGSRAAQALHSPGRDAALMAGAAVTLQLVCTRGLPASGKTTWAREGVANDPARRVRVSRDDFRAM